MILWLLLGSKWSLPTIFCWNKGMITSNCSVALYIFFKVTCLWTCAWFTDCCSYSCPYTWCCSTWFILGCKLFVSFSFFRCVHLFFLDRSPFAQCPESSIFQQVMYYARISFETTALLTAWYWLDLFFSFLYFQRGWQLNFFFFLIPFFSCLQVFWKFSHICFFRLWRTRHLWLMWRV